jgi:hypothetical protein
MFQIITFHLLNCTIYYYELKMVIESSLILIYNISYLSIACVNRDFTVELLECFGLLEIFFNNLD